LATSSLAAGVGVAPRLARLAGPESRARSSRFVLAAVYGPAPLLLLHRATRTSQLPLGPFMVIGTLAAIVS